MTTDEASDIHFRVEENVGVITMDRAPVNAFAAETYLALESVLDTLQGRADCHVILLRSGNSRAFSAGADLTSLPTTLEEDEHRQAIVRRVLDGVLHATKPIVAAIDGPVRGGGCAIAAACDIRVASRRSTFALPEISVGRAGGARHLMRVLPPGEVRLAYFTGRPLGSEDAFRLGMVQELTSDEAGAADTAAWNIAREIAAKNPLAVRSAKGALDLAERLSISDGYRVEQQFGLRVTFGDPQHLNGVRPSVVGNGADHL